jgi:FKBP-type peptidyl-prolyl cis-trans isomerase FkpA
MPRYLLASLSLLIAAFSLSVVGLGCGGAERRQAVAADYAASVEASARPGSGQGAGDGGAAGDPICGEHWKWDGTHCLAADPAAKRAEDLDRGDGGSAPGAASASSTATEGRSRGVGTVGGGSAPEATAAQLVVEDLRVGAGAEAKSGDTVRIHYVGTLLQDGTEFDSSRKSGKPFEFRLGAGTVIKGFDRGVMGMKVGGLRRVTIPPELGYGRRGAPPLIPPRATLVFEIELLEVVPG